MHHLLEHINQDIKGDKAKKRAQQLMKLNTGAKEIQQVNAGGPDNSQSIRPLPSHQYSGGSNISDISADPVPLSDMPGCTVQLYQPCMLRLSIQIRVFVKYCSIMPTGRVPLPLVCETCRLHSWTSS